MSKQKFKFRFIIQVGTDSNIQFYSSSPAKYNSGDEAEVAAFDYMVRRGYKPDKISKKWIHVRKERVNPNHQPRSIAPTPCLSVPRSRDGLAMFDSTFNRKRQEWMRIWDEQVVVANRGAV